MEENKAVVKADILSAFQLPGFRYLSKPRNIPMALQSEVRFVG